MPQPELIGGVRYRVHGEENLPTAKDMRRIILCPKHQSTWETFFLCQYHLAPPGLRVQEGTVTHPYFRVVYGPPGNDPYRPSAQSNSLGKGAEQGEGLMDRGKWIIMFPEGTRGERGQKGNYKSGATRLAVATGAYVVPIAVTSARCWPRRSFSFIPGIIDVSIGQPVSAEGSEPGELMEKLSGGLRPRCTDSIPKPIQLNT